MKRIKANFIRNQQKGYQYLKHIKQKLEYSLFNDSHQKEDNQLQFTKEDDSDESLNEETKTLIVNDNIEIKENWKWDWSLNITLLFLLSKLIQLSIQGYNLFKHEKPLKMGQIVQNVLTDSQSQNSMFYILSNILLIILFYYYFSNMIQYFSVPELKQFIFYIRISQVLFILHLNIDFYRQFFTQLDEMFNLENRMHHKAQEVLSLLVCFWITILILFNLINLVLLLKADNKQNGKPSIWNKTFFWIKIFVLGMLSFTTTIYLPSFYYSFLYEYEKSQQLYDYLQNKDQFTIYQIVHNVPLLQVDFHKLYIYDAYQQSLHLSVCLNWLYLSLYYLDIFYLRKQMQLYPDTDYFMDHRHIRTPQSIIIQYEL